jgi:hypothetical protein
MIVIGSVLLLTSIRPNPAWQQTLAVLFVVWCMATELWFLTTTWRVILNGQEPFAVELAVQQPQLWIPLRPFLGLWWAYHFAMVMVWGVLLCLLEQRLPFAATAAVSVVVSALSYLTFEYVVLAVTAFTSNRHLVLTVWGWRRPWALAHGAVVLTAKLVAILI